MTADAYLPPDQPRCCAQSCMRRTKCLRAIAPHQNGQPVADYSNQPTYGWSAAMCAGFAPVGMWTRPRGAIGPRVHEAPEGLR